MRVRRPLTIGLLILIGVIAVGWATGAFAQLGHMAVRHALAEGRDEVAASRLSMLQWLGGAAESAFLRARLERHRGNYQQMTEWLDTAHRVGYPAEKLERETLLAKAEAGQFDDQTASQLNRWLLEGDQDVREVSAAFANGLGAVGRYEEAQQVLRAWAADFPRDARPLFRLARIEEHQRNKQPAIELYRQAVERDANMVPAIYALGRLLLDQRQVDEALQVLEACPGADRILPVQVLIAMCKKSQTELDQARAILESVLAHPIQEIEAAYREIKEPAERLVAATELGKLESDEGNYERARQWLEKAVAFNERDMEARYAYAVTLRGLGLRDQAEKEFEYVKKTTEALAGVNQYWDRIGNNPADVEARLELAKILLEHESVRNGLYWLRSVQQLDPQNAQAKALLERYATPDATLQ